MRNNLFHGGVVGNASVGTQCFASARFGLAAGLLAMGLAVVFIASCNLSDDKETEPISEPISKVASLPDNRFNGVFGIISTALGSFSPRYTFDGTNKVYDHSSGHYWDKNDETDSWEYKYYSGFTKEFELRNITTEGGEYREKLWDNQFSDWSEWCNYTFNEDGTELTLWVSNFGYVFDYTYVKQ